MPRPASISYEDFAQAARALAQSGQKLTFAAVRVKLGGGSYDVLRRYIDQYAAEQPRRDNELGVPEAVRGGMQALYDQALAEATRRVRAELDADAQALVADREAMAAEHAGFEQRVAQAEAEARLLKDRVAELTGERERLGARADAERERVHELEVRAAVAEAARESERCARVSAIDTAAQERGRLVHEFAGALDRAQTRFEGLQQHALRQVDAIRTRHVETVEGLLNAHLERVAKQLAIGTAAVARLPDRLIDPAVAAVRIDRVATRIETAIDGSTRQVIDQVRSAADQAVAAVNAASTRRPDRKSARSAKEGQGV